MVFTASIGNNESEQRLPVKKIFVNFRSSGVVLDEVLYISISVLFQILAAVNEGVLLFVHSSFTDPIKSPGNTLWLYYLQHFDHMILWFIKHFCCYLVNGEWWWASMVSNETTKDCISSNHINFLSDSAASTAKTTAYISCNYRVSQKIVPTFQKS